jgi:glycosyltransferase involved in cell wall biosynthesis
MMKINVIGIRGFPDIQGGAETHCEQLYTNPYLKKNEFKVFRRKGYVRSKKKFPNITFRDISVSKNKYVETVLHSLLSALITIKDRPSIAHMHNIASAFIIPILRLFGIPVVLTYHSINYEQKKWNWVAKTYLKICEWTALTFANKIIFVSSTNKNKIAKNNRKSIYIPNGVTSLDKIKAEKLNLDLRKGKYILSVGRIVHEKRFDILIDAFQQLNPNIKLVIAGSFDTDKRYYNQILRNIKSKKIIFTGNISLSKIKTLYKDCLFFVLPSENEGMPLVLLEAMSFGLCPITSDILQNMEINKCGYSFKTNDINSLKERLKYAIEHPDELKRKGAECKSFVRSHFRWKNIAKQTLSVYRQIAK